MENHQLNSNLHNKYHTAFCTDTAPERVPLQRPALGKAAGQRSKPSSVEDEIKLFVIGKLAIMRNGSC